MADISTGRPGAAEGASGNVEAEEHAGGPGHRAGGREELPRELLRRWAARYIWWKSPDEALGQPERIVAQVMNIGDYDDVQEMVEALGDETLRDVLRGAEAGVFNERSWAYWHYRLGLAAPGRVPPLPVRRVS